jgi:hypothetical protein
VLTSHDCMVMKARKEFNPPSCDAVPTPVLVCSFTFSKVSSPFGRFSRILLLRYCCVKGDISLYPDYLYKQYKFMDASKAFNTVNRWVLFKFVINRGMLYFIGRLL